MKKAILYLLAFVTSIPLLAQFSKDDQGVSWYLSAGAGYFKPVWDDMDKFSNGYNSFYATDLQTPFKPMNGKFSPRLETGLTFGNSIDIGVAYNFQTEYNMSARFNSGEAREFRLLTSQTELNVRVNVFHIKKVFFGLNMSAFFVKGKMYSGYRYNNNFVSYGTDKRMNGIFSTNDTQLAGGAHIYWLIRKNIALVAEWQYVGLGRALILGKTDVLGIKDKLDGYGAQYSNHQYTQYYPRDYERMGDPYAYFVGQGDLLRPSLSGSRFTLALRYNLRLTKD